MNCSLSVSISRESVSRLPRVGLDGSGFSPKIFDVTHHVVPSSGHRVVITSLRHTRCYMDLITADASPASQ
jgi:hypothetical protein